jgi:hypothetical protein
MLSEPICLLWVKSRPALRLGPESASPLKADIEQPRAHAHTHLQFYDALGVGLFLLHAIYWDCRAA